MASKYSGFFGSEQRQVAEGRSDVGNANSVLRERRIAEA